MKVWNSLPVEANNAIYFEIKLDSVTNQIISRFTGDVRSLDFLQVFCFVFIWFWLGWVFLPLLHSFYPILIYFSSWGTVVPNFSPTDSIYTCLFSLSHKKIVMLQICFLASLIPDGDGGVTKAKWIATFFLFSLHAWNHSIWNTRADRSSQKGNFTEGLCIMCISHVT